MMKKLSWTNINCQAQTGNATLLLKGRIVSNSVDTTIDTICADSGIVVLPQKS